MVRQGNGFHKDNRERRTPPGRAVRLPSRHPSDTFSTPVQKDRGVLLRDGQGGIGRAASILASLTAELNAQEVAWPSRP